MDTFTVKRQGDMILANALQNTLSELLSLKLVSYKVDSMSDEVLIKINLKICTLDALDQDYRKINK